MIRSFLRLFFIAPTALIVSVSSAQQNTVASGGDGTGSGGSISFSVGQIDYLFTASPAGSLSPGVQQSYPDLEISVGELALPFAMQLYPNPTRSLTVLELPDDGALWHAELCDARGRTVSRHDRLTGFNQLDLSVVSSGMYHLRIYRNTQFAGHFKVMRAD